MNEPDQPAAHPYDALGPDTILDAVESFGLRPDGALLALNSYENRVYQVRLEDRTFVVAKFYRPGRWDDATIGEEHAFALELAEAEVPVVAPLVGPGGQALYEHAGFRFALYPRRGGRWPELEDPQALERIGRFLGRLHAVGAARPFAHRPALTVARLGEEPLAWLLAHDLITPDYRAQYQNLAETVIAAARAAFVGLGDLQTLRLHGDVHGGNILWTDRGAHVVDLDDCCTGPAMQDLWMLLSGDRAAMTIQLCDLLEGYEQFHDFDRRELRLIEPLRGLRLIHYAGWLARRRDDPAFRLAFPWFASARYWEEQVLTLREQVVRLEMPALVV